MEGTFLVSDALRVGVAITKGKTDITVALRLTNLLNQELGEVCVDICASLNHLPGNPGWCNRFFLGDAPLDRYVQGRIWYERISPHRLHAFTETGWVPMHPSPDAPSSDAVPQYNFLCSETADAFACAVQSPDDRFFFFQAWNTPCFYLTPCPGNACMHLEPLVARRLAPGEEAEIRALIGMYEGNRESLTARINQFREAGL